MADKGGRGLRNLRRDAWFRWREWELEDVSSGSREEFAFHERDFRGLLLERERRFVFFFFFCGTKFEECFLRDFNIFCLSYIIFNWKRILYISQILHL